MAGTGHARQCGDGAVMAVSSDGVLIHIRDEGWKEVKTLSVSALLPGGEQGDEQEAGAELHPTLTRHSYRAGLWDAATFTGHHWAEACRRGVDQAQRVLCISDGAAWIWAMVLMCFAVRVEILDFWHAVQRLWTLAQPGCATPEVAAAWVAQQKGALAHSHLRQVLQAVRRLYPRGQALPDAVRQAIGYLFHNRRRMDYAAFRAAGFPIGSGTIESACKTVVQARMKQAGMRWSRPGAQAMLALRALLLSDRWQELPSLAPPD